MTTSKHAANRYWGERKVPEAKKDFFNAVTTPAPSGAGTVATIRMYGPIDSWGGFWGISTKDVGQVLDQLPDEVTQIILRINSPGGEVFEGVSILNMLRAHKASVTAVVDGLAASAASVIAAGCDDTVMSPGTQMMIHSPSTITWGNATDLRKDADLLDGIETSLIEIYEAKAGAKDWAGLLAAETWMNAAETVAAGLADRVAVIPDAGEAETVGSELIEPPDDDTLDDVARARTKRHHSRAAATAHELPSSTEPGDPNRKENVVAYDDLKAGLRERLGVTDAAASDDVLLAAVDETLAETADPTTAVPAGTTLIDSTVLAELQANAQAGARALAAQDAARRDGIVDKAIEEGRITASNRETWRTMLDNSEEGTTSLLASLAANTAIPVKELGNSSAAESTEAEGIYAKAWGNDENKEA
jgi:ATP-dependent protease ClpP protease subunit